MRNTMDCTRRKTQLAFAAFALAMLIVPSLSPAQDKTPASELKKVVDWNPTPAMIESARGSNPRFNMASRVLAAEYTGLSRADLGQARQQAIPLADLIKKNGRSVDEYLERTLKIAEGVLQLNIKEGLVDQSRADSIRLIMPTMSVRWPMDAWIGLNGISRSQYWISRFRLLD